MGLSGYSPPLAPYLLKLYWKQIIYIESPDRMTSLGQQNLIRVVTEVESDNYTIATGGEILDNEYCRNQF